jgi:hypothetical protein
MQRNIAGRTVARHTLAAADQPCVVLVCSFLKKRTKRLLRLRWRHDPGHGRHLSAGAGIKVFCFFSSEKKAFLT